MSAASGQPPMGLQVTPQRAVTVPSMHLPTSLTQSFLLILSVQAKHCESEAGLCCGHAAAASLYKGGVWLACIRSM